MVGIPRRPYDGSMGIFEGMDDQENEPICKCGHSIDRHFFLPSGGRGYCRESTCHCRNFERTEEKKVNFKIETTGISFDLKPCPLCGGPSMMVYYCENVPAKWGTACNNPEGNCHIRGPRRQTPEEAVKVWNDRPQNNACQVMKVIPRYVDGSVISRGDKVVCVDNSYILKLVNDGGVCTTWTNDMGDGLVGKKLVIVDFNLKVPYMTCFRNVVAYKIDSNGKMVYLDVLLKDEDDNRWMTQSNYLVRAK